MRAPALLLLAASRLAAAETGGSLAAAITREGDRLRQRAGSAVSEPAGSRLSGFLGRVREDLQNGRVFLALEDLDRARDSSVAILADAGGRDSFEARWKAASAELSRFGGGAKPGEGALRALAVRALGETAQGKVVPLVQASRPYAAATGEGSGLYYLAEARSVAQFADFCRALDAPPTGTAPPTRSIAGELRRIQDRTNAAFHPPQSIDRHAEFIRLNAVLKTAGELDAAGLHAGALYQYLEAVQQLAGIEGRAQPAGGADPRTELARRHAELSRSGRDDSLALLFVERGEAVLARSSDPGARAYADVILADVLPAYESALAEAAPSGKPPSEEITVTLVRWPYT